MKIINDTGETIGYIVTPSGTIISGSKIIASGYVPPNAAYEFTVSGAGIQPIVYVKSVSQYNQGYIGRKAANSGSVVRIGITEG